jgi:predicted DCC family thiol-disulfide oxidoreductase YuxK
LAILPFSHELFPVLMASVPRERWHESMHVVRRDGSVRSAGAAVLEIMKLKPTTRVVAWAAHVLPPLRHRIDRDYARLASRRGELSDRVPDAEQIVIPPRLLSQD